MSSSAKSSAVAAILRLDGGVSSLFMSEILFRPLIGWLMEMLRGAGVTSLLLISDSPEHIPDTADFLTVYRACGGDMREALINLARSEPKKTLIFCKPVLLEQDILNELIAFLENGSRAAITASGAYTGIYGVSGADARDFALTEAIVCGGELGDMYTIDSEEVGCICAPVSELSDVYREELRLRDRINFGLMKRGVRFVGESYISPDCEIGEGTTILPGSIVKGRSVIGRGCVIGPNSVINACSVGDGAVINCSQLNESKIGPETAVGPFAYIRPGTEVGQNVRVGDFVELKNSVIGNGTKIAHLTYIGDATVGKNVNFGCGSVTVNYDGVKKHRTIIEDGAFIGCNTNLVAPVHVGKNAYTAAGTTVTDDIPEDSLAIGRVKQTIQPGWADKPYLKRRGGQN
jgi:bifunctional UDP-N-acetylglucosamine pyrophosphorylase/glucosamine-1-phosphate N-acetyltransferase